jgi:hypothetical protein
VRYGFSETFQPKPPHKKNMLPEIRQIIQRLREAATLSFSENEAFKTMNCERCQALVNDYLDGNLNQSECAALEQHLELCAPCGVFHADLTAILNCCYEVRQQPDAPPNSHALWLRISNLIESEQIALASAKDLQPAPVAGYFTRIFNRSWQFSAQQIASGVAGIVVITALLTVVGLQQNRFQASQTVTTAGAASSDVNLTGQFLRAFSYQNATDAPHAAANFNASRWKEQQVAIEYWRQRVESRKRQWNQHLRDAFDRNLHELDAVVAEYQQQLERNPHDYVSEEMLDSALKDKMELLREFADL